MMPPLCANAACPAESLPTSNGVAGRIPSDLDSTIDLNASLRRLPRRERLAVDLRYFADLSTTETAAVMGCSEGTVKSTLASARQRLRTLLG